MFPEKLINNENKDDNYFKEVAKYILSSGASDFHEDNVKDRKCWNIYHGIVDNTKFEYLTKVEGFTYPAKFRNIGNEIVRSKLNILESKQARRSFKSKAIAMDERTLQLKYENRIKASLNARLEMYKERDAIVQQQIQEVQDRMSDMQKQLEVQPDNEQAQAQMEELKKNMPMIQLEMQKLIRNLSRVSLDNNEMQKRIDYFLLNTDVEIMQQVANAALKSAIQTEDLKQHWNVGLREKIATGKPTYITYYNPRTKNVVFKQVDANTAAYSKGGNNRWTQNGEWCFTKEYMNKSQVFSEFELTKSEELIIQAYSLGDATALKNYVGNSAYFDNSENFNDQHNAIEVSRIWFLAPREIFWKKTPNKYRPEEYFVHLTTKDAKLKKDEIRNRAVIYDMYHVVVIGNVIHLNMGKQENVFRPIDMPGLPTLPLVAKSFNTASEKPYSLIWRVRELIELYDIVNYKKELTIALSGVKGMIMDKSQKPDNMTSGKWMYYRKLGTMWIETMKKGRKTPASYNQFQNYDDTITQSITFIDNVLNGIDSLIGKLIGITDASLGQFVSSDPVSNVNMSREQSSLITEIQYSENDAVFDKAIELYLNLKIRYTWKDGKVLNYLDKDLEEVLVQIPKGTLNGSDFRIYSSNNVKEESRLEDLRTAAMQSWGRAELPFTSVVSMFKIDDLTEMENKLIQMSKEAEAIRQQNAAATETAKEEAKQKTINLQGQIDMQLLKVKDEFDLASREIEKARLQLDEKRYEWESEFKERELVVKEKTENFKIMAQNDIESAYLDEEGRSNRVQEMMKQFEIKMNAILSEAQLKTGELQSIRKTEVDHEKNMRNKVNIKDS